ncbi:MAG: ribonuclease P protein component, partial [Erysipelotrichaceae bacterium]|nr:ribonuclease P protein component [Erysipelotrichaceae bacterium]
MKKLYRVRKNEEFSKIIALKHSAANAFFVVYSSPKKEGNARVGISVSKKLGNAV